MRRVYSSLPGYEACCAECTPLSLVIPVSLLGSILSSLVIPVSLLGRNSRESRHREYCCTRVTGMS